MAPIRSLKVQYSADADLKQFYHVRLDISLWSAEEKRQFLKRLHDAGAAISFSVGGIGEYFQ